MKVFEVASFHDLSFERENISKEVEHNNVALIRGMLDPNLIRESLAKFMKSVRDSEILGTTQGSSELVRRNSFKWSVGASTGAQIGNARLMVIGYNPIAAPDIFGFRSSFEILIKLRDCLRGDSICTNDESLNNGSFNACRFQLYPAGGGFMLGHVDYIAEKTSLDQRAPLIQLLVFLTERGVDFQTGGAYLVNGEKLIDVESYARCGDIAIYNGNSFHGVRDIDPDVPLSTSNLTGRVVGLVTIYK